MRRRRTSPRVRDLTALYRAAEEHDKREAERNSVIIYALSILGALAVFGAVWTGHAGYLQ